MARRKVTFVYDPEKRRSPGGEELIAVEEMIRAMRAVDSLSVTVEDLPDPPIVQKFVVERVATPQQGRKTAGHVYARLSSYPGDGQITVTEVTGA